MHIKKHGFMLFESLIAVIILGLAVGTITQVLFVRFRRMRQSSDAITAQLVLAKKMGELLTAPKITAEETKLTDFGESAATFEIVERKIKKESDLHSFRNFIKPICATIKVKNGAKDEVFKLLGFKLLAPDPKKDKAT